VKLNVERKPASLVVLDITADDDEFAEAMVRAVRKVSRDVQVPGFRKGKAPRSMVERLYGRDVFLREAADDVMERLYRDALKQEDITPIGEPSVEINQLEPVNFVVTIPVYPAIELGDYAGVRVDPVDAAVSDDDVEELIQRLHKAQSPWVEVADARRAVEGDQVTIDYEVLDGDQPFQDPVTDAVFVLGETNLLTQLREKIEEMNVGDTETFELVFDEDDETADAAIRGKALSYKVTLKALSERQMVELDDEFASKVTGAESMDALREELRQDIHQGKTTDARTGVVNEIIERMLESAVIDPPQTMIEEETEHQLQRFKETLGRSNTPYEGYLRAQDTTEDEIKDDLRPEAERRLRSSLFLAEVGKSEGIEVSEEELEAEIARLTALIAPPAQAGIAGAESELEDLEADGGDLDELVEAEAELDELPVTPDVAGAELSRMQQFYRSDYFRNMLRNEVYQRKLTDRLIEIATEGNGAVLNGWVAPEPVDPPDTTAEIAYSAGDSATPETPVMETAGATDEVDPTEANVAEATADKGTSSKLPSEGEGTDWMAGDGTNDIPDGFTIKGNASSRIYHPEASPSYDNTIAELYFANPDAAERAGYRLPKSMPQTGTDASEEASDLAEAAADAVDDGK